MRTFEEQSFTEIAVPAMRNSEQKYHLCKSFETISEITSFFTAADFTFSKFR